MKYLQNFLFSILITVLLFPINCSAQTPSQLEKKVSVNGVVYNVPVSLSVSVGDTLEIVAISFPPYYFEKWSGDLSYSLTNPTKLVVSKPMTIIIDYKQISAFSITLSSITFNDKRTLEFSVYIKTDSLLTLSAYQGSIKLDTTFIKTGSILTFAYVSGSSQNNLIPNNGVNIYTDEGIKKLAFGTQPLQVTIPPNTNNMTLGTFKLTSSQDFLSFNPLISWIFTGAINTIFTGTGYADITGAGNFSASYKRYVKVGFE